MHSFRLHTSCLSQACSEEGKAHTSIAFVPRISHVIISLQVLETAERGDLKGGRPGLGTFSGPDEGTSTLEKRQRSIKMKGTSTVELQMELQKVRMLRKEKVLQEILLCIDWKRYSNIFQEDKQNITVY